MNSASECFANNLGAAEDLLGERQFGQARELALKALAAGERSARAMVIIAEASSFLEMTDEAEDYYRQALALQPAKSRALLGLARLLHRSGRHEEALAPLKGFLADKPSHLAAISLISEVLEALGRVRDAAPWLEAAIAHAPGNARLQLLHGEWLLRCGEAEEGVDRLHRLLDKKPANPQAWLTLMREHEAREDWNGALQRAEEAVESCPQTFWLWSRQLQMLAAANRQAELEAAIDSRPPPAIEKTKAFIEWARLMWRLDCSSRVHRVLEQSGSSAHSLLEPYPEGLQLLVDLAREAGRPAQALNWLQKSMAGRGASTRLLRQAFDLSLLQGDVALASELLTRLQQSNPRFRSGLEVDLLAECRIFAGAMRQVAEAMQLEPVRRLTALSRIVLDEPGCLPAAMAWANQFAARSAGIGLPLERGEEEHPIPSRLFYSVDPSPAWQREHAAYDWRDLRDPGQFIAARARLPAQASRLLMRHPDTTRLDILRFASLGSAGGWWVKPTSHCGAPVAQLAQQHQTLVACIKDNGLLSTSLFGCTPGHPAIAQALEIALTALTEFPRADATLLISGEPAITLGVAVALSQRILDEEIPDDGSLITTRRRNRWHGMAWPS